MRRPPILLLAAIVVTAAALWAAYGVRVHALQPDEVLHLTVARWVPDGLPGSLLDGEAYERGPQRLYVWLLALPTLLGRAPADLVAGHVLGALAFASAAVPAWLLGRAAGLGDRVALVPAALSVLAPLGIVATALLTETVAYPLCLWTLWAMWRALVAPSARRDLLALALLVLAVLARANMLVLGPAFVLAAVAQEARFGELPGSLWRRHRVLAVLVAAGAVAVAAELLGRSVVGYPVETTIDPRLIAAKVAQWLARVAVATAVIPAVLGVAWTARELVRPAGAREHAFAAVAVCAGSALLLSAYDSTLDERYALYLLPLVLAAAGAAVAGRAPLRARWALLATAGLVLLLARVPWDGDRGTYGFFAFPVETFVDRSILIPRGDLAGLALAVVAGLAAAAVLVRRRAAGVAVAAVTVAMLAMTFTSLEHFVGGADALRAGEPRIAGVGAPPGLRDRAVLDERDAGTTGMLAVSGAGQATFFDTWRDLRLFNATARTFVSVDEPLAVEAPVGTEALLAAADARTGVLSAPRTLPRVLAVSLGFQRVGLAGRAVARAPGLELDVLRRDEPARLRFRVDGAGADGFLAPDAKLRSRAGVTVWGAGLDRRRAWCARVGVMRPPGLPGRRRVTVTAPGAGTDGGVAVGAGQAIVIDRRLPGVASRPSTLVRVEADGFDDLAGRLVAVRLTGFAVAPC